MLVGVVLIDPADQPERAPGIEAAAVKFGYEIEALLSELGFERGVPDRRQE